MSLEEWLKAREGERWTERDTAFVVTHVAHVERSWKSLVDRIQAKPKVEVLNGEKA